METFRRVAATSLFLTIFTQFAIAAVTQSTLKACNDINTALPDRVHFPGVVALEYDLETSKYWSTALREVDPACIVVPESPTEVATIVQILNAYSDVRFTVRSGGHDPNVGHATVQDGVLITMTKMVGATYDAEKGLAYVKPGGEWNDVIGALEESGVAIVGGRLGLVGVGGYLLQGGISFLSAQYGLAADSIVGWETIMANGSIVTIDAATQPDLAVAMRGSGNQFGIVTQFIVKARPIGQVWGGLRMYDSSQDDKVYATLHNFTANGSQDPKAAIIHSSLIAVGGATNQLIYYFYDGPEPPTTGPFADFLKIPALVDITKTQSYSSLLKSNGEPARLLNSRISFRTYTIPYLPNNPNIYAEIRNKLRDITKDFLTILRPTSQVSLDFQPLPSLIGKHSEEAGGNAMGLTSSDPDRLILEIQSSWVLPSDDALAYSLSRQLTDWLAEKIPQWLTDAGMEPTVYLPYFMNDAAGDQNVTGSYKQYAKFKALQEDLDPKGLFSTRAGGFKY